MQTTTVITSASREHLLSFLRSIPARLSGTVRDPQGVGEGFRARIGFMFYSLIAPAFEIKGRGGVDDAGDSWPANSPEYLAYGKGPKSSRMGSGKSPGHESKKGSGYLSAKDLKVWYSIYGRALAALAPRHALRDAKAMAAAIAWKAWKSEGGRTLLEVYGKRADQVLVDEGTLRRSIQVGHLQETAASPSANYTAADSDQIFDVQPGRVVVGSRAPTAAFHHNAKRMSRQSPGRGPIRRRLWPEYFPSDWWRQINDQLVAGMFRIARLVERGDL